MLVKNGSDLDGGKHGEEYIHSRDPAYFSGGVVAELVQF